MKRDKLIRSAMLIDNIAAFTLTIIMGGWGIREAAGDWRITLAILILNPFLFIGLRFIWHYTLGSVLFLILFIVGGHGDGDD